MLRLSVFGVHCAANKLTNCELVSMDIFPFVALTPRPDQIAKSQALYNKAREQYDQLRADGAYVKVSTPGLYLLKITLPDGRQCYGLSGLVNVSEYKRADGKGIRPHEATLVDSIQEHRERMMAQGALIKPVLLTCAGIADFAYRLPAICQELTPLLHYFRDGISIEVYHISETALLEELSGAVAKHPGLFAVADGHHRISTVQEAAALYGDRYAQLPVVIIPENTLGVDTFIRSINPNKPIGLEDIATLFTVAPIEVAALPTKVGQWLLAHQGKYYLLSAREKGPEPDAVWFDAVVLRSLFGITDSRSDPRLQSKEASSDLALIQRLTERASEAWHFWGYPLPMSAFYDCIRQGQLLPPKSTYFFPRIPTGLLIYDF